MEGHSLMRNNRFSSRFLGCLVFAGFLLSVPLRPQEKPSLKIGFLVDSLKVERWQTDVQAFQARARELGADVIVESAEGDDELQFQQAQKLIHDGVKVLLLVPHDTAQAVPLVSFAHAQNVPVVCYERLIRNSNIDAFVGSDAEAIGELQASSLTRLAPTGNYVLVGGSPTDDNAQLLRKGQMKILQPYIDRGDIHIVGDFWAKDWKPEEAYARMVEVLNVRKADVTAVVASNDGTAGGVVQALQEHQLDGRVFVSGQDADLAAILRVLSGTQAMTVYKPIREQARLAADAAVALAKGQPLDSTASIANGSRNVPAFFVTPVEVTKDNVMATVIKDGFQNLDTIHKSLPEQLWPK
jgi:D-xylose transport system substrate-binding protein